VGSAIHRLGGGEPLRGSETAATIAAGEMLNGEGEHDHDNREHEQPHGRDRHADPARAWPRTDGARVQWPANRALALSILLSGTLPGRWSSVSLGGPAHG